MKGWDHVKEIDLHEYFLEDAIAAIVDTVEECSAAGVCELVLVHGYSHGDLIKKWIWSEALAVELRKVNVKLIGREKIPKNPGATLIHFADLV